ncbi:MAG TPA: peptidase S10 [Candidatus Dormibacteraeota bacterium]|nr:peptidase S10 [Candidatus Dormibacteraeota bacterium]
MAQQPGGEKTADKSADKAGEKPKEDKKAPEDKSVLTKHSVKIGGQEVKYTATAGTMVLKLEDGTAKASVFYVAYTKDDVTDASKRPITFAFNGGPGAGSLWLHVGALGPRRVEMGDEGNLLPPPYKFVDNEASILDVTDIVFIDPVTTGYSRPVPGEADKQFHGVQEDVQSVGDFIRLWATRNRRWGSPKFLAGESYGTTRAAGLSGYLQQRYGMYLNGIILISSILNFQTAEFDTGNDLPYILYLPTYTAIAWYHKKLPSDLQGDLQKAIAESKAFATGSYADALMAGDALPAAKRTEIAQKLSRLTGISADYVDRADLRIEIQRFDKELMKTERRTVGRLDGRFTGIDADAAGEQPDYDPSLAAIVGPYTATLNEYVRGELKFESDLPYEFLTGRVRPWNYAPYENRYVNVAETLRRAMTQNQFLHVFVGKGYYDLATPFFAADYTFDHLGLDPTLRSHISGGYYEAGHMMYVHHDSLMKLKLDLTQFIQASLPK